MHRVIARVLVLVASLPALASAQTTTVRSYPIPGQGALELAVPLRWVEEIAPAQPGEPTRLTFRPDAGAGFALSVVVHRPDGSADFNSRERLRALVEESAKEMLALQPDTPLLTEELHGAHAFGYVYSVTDHGVTDPAPDGSFRVMTQGTLAAGELLVVATMLTQKSWGTELDAALDVLRSARHSARQPDAWRAAVVPPRPAAGRNARYRLDLPPTWQVLSENPFTALGPEGGRLEVRVEERSSDPLTEVTRLVQAQERRSQDNVLVRRHGRTRLDGVDGREYAFVDELRDVMAHHVVICPSDLVVTLTFTAHPRAARRAEADLREAIEAFDLL